MNIVDIGLSETKSIFLCKRLEENLLKLLKDLLYKQVYKRIIVSHISNIATKDVKLRMHLTNFVVLCVFQYITIILF